MVNPHLFQTARGAMAPRAAAVNSEGSRAYAFEARHALAQYAATGCLNSTFYARADEQLTTVLALCAEVDDKFIARTALWARERGHMKDMPVVLLAVLTTRNTRLVEHVFARIVDSGKVLRSFVAVMRSGAVGRKSFGTTSKRLILRWLESRTDEQIFRASVGSRPSLADIVKMVHPKPATESRKALYGWLVGRTYDASALPECVRAFEAWKRDDQQPVPDAPIEMLMPLAATPEAWRTIARRANWQQTRMNLSTFARHGVFGGAALERSRWLSSLFATLTGRAAVDEDSGEGEALARLVAERLGDERLARAARALPFQILSAHRSAEKRVPAVVRDALAQALQAATARIPNFTGRTWVAADVSGSMLTPITGKRGDASSKVRCIDVAALIASCVLHKSRTARVIAFADDIVPVRLRAQDSVFENAARLAALGGGGTNCSAPLAWLNEEREPADLVILISDNESWVDGNSGRGTPLLAQWNHFKLANKNARLVCLDLQPNRTTQALTRTDILNIGGFTDHVFTLIEDFAAGRLASNHWVEAIENIAL